MSEPTKNILEVRMLEDEVARLFPEAWKALPRSQQSVYQKNDDQGNLEYLAPVVPIILKCEGEKATDEEIGRVIEAIKAKGTPVAFLVHLACLDVVDFPDGEDPTVKDFFEGNFDASKMKTKLALVSYPHFVETK